MHWCACNQVTDNGNITRQPLFDRTIGLWWLIQSLWLDWGYCTHCATNGCPFIDWVVMISMHGTRALFWCLMECLIVGSQESWGRGVGGLNYCATLKLNKWFSVWMRWGVMVLLVAVEMTCPIISYHIVLYPIISYQSHYIVLYYIVSYPIISYHILSYHIISI